MTNFNYNISIGNSSEWFLLWEDIYAKQKISTRFALSMQAICRIEYILSAIGIAILQTGIAKP